MTYGMSANYFLFATLEQARNIAAGRSQQDQRSMTVLTGTPVAGMVYLDRPAPAGYFIFPDLSVRHEGRYRLSFSLYEELKEDKDADRDEDITKSNGAEDAHVTHRLEVKSVPFTVFSAKKFPGLTESTSLSRMVAEQGCRVRIRRDVRMRRRDTKGGKDWDGYEDDTADDRARMSATPDGAVYSALPPPQGYMDPISRPRSSSNASHHSLAHSISLSRRPSLQDASSGYHQSTTAYGTAPHTPQSAYPQSSPYGPSPTQQYSQPPFMQAQSTMQPPPPQYHQQTYHAPTPIQPTAPPQQGYYGYGSAATAPAPSQSHYVPQPSNYEAAQPHRMSVDYTSQISNEHRRSSTQYAPPPPPPPLRYGAQQNQPTYHNQAPSQTGYQSLPPPSQTMYANHHAQQSSHGPVDSYGNRPAPLEPVQPIPRATGASTPISGRPPFHDKLPPLNTTLGMITNKHIEPSSPSSAAPVSSYYTSAQTPTDSHKRGFGQVFNERHLSQPLRQGARPSDAGYGDQSMTGVYAPSADVDDDETDLQRNKQLSYRRANGLQVNRALPAYN